MRDIEFAPRFKKDFRDACHHPDYDREDFLQLLEDLSASDSLPGHYREHALEKRAKNLAGYQECHLGPDLVAIFKRFPGVVRLYRIGGHKALLG